MNPISLLLARPPLFNLVAFVFISQGFWENINETQRPIRAELIISSEASMFLNAVFALICVLIVPLYWLLQKSWKTPALILFNALVLATWCHWSAIWLFISAALEYLIIFAILNSKGKSLPRLYLGLSISINAAIWLFFKYNHFFMDDLIALLPRTLLPSDPHLIGYIAPLGLSFFTLQKMTLTIESYWGSNKILPKFSSFIAFCTFFPLSASGPIERAKRLLPQFDSPALFNWNNIKITGVLILTGMFKKLFMAGHLAEFTDHYFAIANPDLLQTMLGLWSYAFQLYADFSGYSDLAIGIALLFGFKVMDNFQAPYFSLHLSEYWKRWHISLSSWLNDYIFNPTAFSLKKHPVGGAVLAVFITFSASGLWHGTGWNFIVWGLFHATIISLHMISKKQRKKFWKHIPQSFHKAISILLTFQCLCFGYLLFHSPDLGTAIHRVISSLDTEINWSELLSVGNLAALIALGVFEQYQVWKSKQNFWIIHQGPWTRALMYTLMLLALLHFQTQSAAFIYVQF